MADEADKYANLPWRKSKRSGPQGGQCVELAPLPGGGTAVRHSQDHSKVIEYTSAEMDKFIRGVKDGEFDDHLVPS